jgi:hypothetical protein
MSLSSYDHWKTTEPDVAGNEPEPESHPFVPDFWKRGICSAKVAGINGRTETCNRPAAEHEEQKRCGHTTARLCFQCGGEPGDDQDHELNRGDYLRGAERDR